MSDAFPCLKLDPKAESRYKLRGKAPFVCECLKAFYNLPGSSDLSRLERKLYWDLVVGSASDPLMDWLGWSMEEVHSHWRFGLLEQL